MFGVLLFIIGLILISVFYNGYLKCTGNTSPILTTGTMSPEQKDCMQEYVSYGIAGFYLMVIAFIIIFIATLNATYNGCFKTAISGTLLSLLILA